MPKKKKILKQKHLPKLNFITLMIVVVSILIVLSMYFLWLLHQSSSLMTRMENEVASLNLPDEKHTIYTDDSGCKPSIFGGLYCERTISYNYNHSLFGSKNAIIQSLDSNGWIKNEDRTNDNSSLNYLKKSDNNYLCLAVSITQNGSSATKASVTIQSDETASCKSDIGKYLREH
ncbi:MAG: hypothetical protein WAQ27_03630 [Candidatus Microsaccharimonas sp.]